MHRSVCPHAFRIPSFILVWALASLTTVACSTETTAREDTAVTVPAVEVVQARVGRLPLVTRVTGTVRATGEVAIFPEVSGPVAQVFVQNGDAVKRGDPLVRVQAAGSQGQLQQARSNVSVARAEVREIEASLEDLRRQYERAEQLGEQGLVAREQVEGLRAKVDATQASLARARAQVAAAQAGVAELTDVQRQTVVRAPIDGRVGQRNVEVGMRVDPQTQLFVVGRLEDMRVEVPVTQEILTRLREGQRVAIRAGSGSGTELTAAISRISPFLAPGSFSAEVEIDVADAQGLVPGMFVTADIFYGESEPATLVPTSALYEDPATGEQGVFVVADPAALVDEGGTLTTDPVAVPFRTVSVIASGPQTAGVNGVQPNDWVVVVGQHLLSPQGGEEDPRARVRTVEWNGILELQNLQREDLLRQFMQRQQELSRGTPPGPGR